MEVSSLTRENQCPNGSKGPPCSDFRGLLKPVIYPSYDQSYKSNRHKLDFFALYLYF